MASIGGVGSPGAPPPGSVAAMKAQFLSQSQNDTAVGAGGVNPDLLVSRGPSSQPATPQQPQSGLALPPGLPPQVAETMLQAASLASRPGGTPTPGAPATPVRMLAGPIPGTLDMHVVEGSEIRANGAPFVKVYVGPEMQSTNPQAPGNPAPRWDQTLRINVPPGVPVFKLEVWEEGGTAIGGNGMVTLANVMQSDFEDVWVGLTGPDGQPAGRVHLTMRFTPAVGPGGIGGPTPVQSTPPPSTSQQPPPPSVPPTPPVRKLAGPIPGTLDMHVVEGSEIRANGAPFVKVYVGPEMQSTNPQAPGNPAPRWDQTLRINVPPGVPVFKLELWQENGSQSEVLAGNGAVTLANVMQSDFEDVWVSLSGKDGQPAGRVHLTMRFAPAAEGSGPASALPSTALQSQPPGAPVGAVQSQPTSTLQPQPTQPPPTQTAATATAGPPTGTLDITVVCGRKLKNMDTFKKQDPYCILKVGAQQHKTKVHSRGGTAPIWGEKFSFNIAPGVDTLSLECFDKDQIGSDDAVGENKNIPLAPVFAAGYTDTWINIIGGSTFGKNAGKDHGQIQLQMKFTPGPTQAPPAPATSRGATMTGPTEPKRKLAGPIPGTLDVFVIEAKEIRCALGPFVKLYFGTETPRTATQQPGNTAPQWRQSVRVNVPPGVPVFKLELWHEGNGQCDVVAGNAAVTLANAMQNDIDDVWVPLSDISGQPCGAVHLAMRFTPISEAPPSGHCGTLSVTAAGARSLKDLDVIGKMDPYCVLKCAGQEHRTIVHENGGSGPKWEEEFVFNIVPGVHMMSCLVFDKDPHGGDDFVGENNNISLERVITTGNDDTWTSIVGPGSKPGPKQGSVHLRMKFVPATGPTVQAPPPPVPRSIAPPPVPKRRLEGPIPGALAIRVMEGQNLRCAPTHAPFVKVFVGPQVGQTNPQQPGNPQPRWDQTLTMQVPPGVPTFKLELWQAAGGQSDVVAGNGAITLANAMQNDTDDVWVQLSGKDGSSAGNVHLGLHFTPAPPPAPPTPPPAVEEPKPQVPSEPKERVGVGIFFQQDMNTGMTFVKTIVDGGSAQRSRKVTFGDIITHVDGYKIEGASLQALRTRLLGEEGTIVNLCLRKLDGTPYDVDLMRGSAAYLRQRDGDIITREMYDKLQGEYDQLHMQHQRLRAEAGNVSAQTPDSNSRLWSQTLEAEVVRLLSQANASEAEILRLNTTLAHYQANGSAVADRRVTELNLENERLKGEVGRLTAILDRREYELSVKDKELALLRTQQTANIGMSSRLDMKERHASSLQALLQESENARSLSQSAAKKLDDELRRLNPDRTDIGEPLTPVPYRSYGAT